MMQRHWWKALGVCLVLYGLIVGFLVPLKPGIVDVQPLRANAGQSVNLAVQGYNSFYKEAGGTHQAWLKIGDYLIKSSGVQVQDEQNMKVSFDLPAHLPIDETVSFTTLVLYNEKDGTSLLPNALSIVQESVDVSQGKSAWNAQIGTLNKVDMFRFPFRNILLETIRNTYFHVALWFAMLFMFFGSFIHSIQYLRKQRPILDKMAVNYARVGFLFGLLGLTTGAVWAQFTWGKYWSWDIKQVMTLVCMSIYAAYLIFRVAIADTGSKGKISAAYNIFAFIALIPLLYVVPRMVDSLHPGAGGNPAFGGEDLDNTMRKVFYPIIIGWTLIGRWMATLLNRMDAIVEEVNDRD